MTAGFELFDHTADLGARVRAATAAELIPPATEALYAAIGELAAEEAGRRDKIEITTAPHAAGDRAYLLRDYLAELLVRFERDATCFTPQRVAEFSDARLAVEGTTAPLDESRSAYAREVKAVTYHELTVRPLDTGGWEAVFIVDI